MASKTKSDQPVGTSFAAVAISSELSLLLTTNLSPLKSLLAMLMPAMAARIFETANLAPSCSAAGFASVLLEEKSAQVFFECCKNARL